MGACMDNLFLATVLNLWSKSGEYLQNILAHFPQNNYTLVPFPPCLLNIYETNVFFSKQYLDAISPFSYVSSHV